MSKKTNELDLCDDEIRAVFENLGDRQSYFIGTPTVAQLTKEVRLLREVIERISRMWVQEPVSYTHDVTYAVSRDVNNEPAN